MKIGIIGAGFVGSTTAYTLAIKSLAQEIVLIDLNQDRATAEALDVLHAAALNNGCKIYNGSYEDLDGAEIVVITVDSKLALTGNNRLALLESNTKIMKAIIPDIVKNAPDCKIVIATNPVDVITKIVLDISKFPRERVIGSGTVLDTARFRSMLSEKIGMSPKSIHAYVLGEHGSSSLVSWSTAHVGGEKLEVYAQNHGQVLTDEYKKTTAKEVIDVGFKIYHGKSATYYGIASSLVSICEAIINDEARTLTVSTLHDEVEGYKDICLSLPTIVDKNGAHDAFVPNLSKAETNILRHSAMAMSEATAEAEKFL